MESVIIGLFCISLFICVVFDISIVFALITGLLLFIAYGLYKGYKTDELLKSCFSGVKPVTRILITFFLIGMLTAMWRQAGTISVIVCFISGFINPAVYLLMTFWLNCLISFLTGTAFGTAATMGVICSTIGTGLGIPASFIGGAVLSGVFFGDRCSPVSTSALLISTITKTNIYSNIKNMFKTSVIPFAVTSFIYLATGFVLNREGEIPDLKELFSREFNLSFLAVLPAVILLVLAVCKVNVIISMAASIIVTVPIILFVQDVPVSELPGLLLFGFYAKNGDVSLMLDGGGIVSMMRVTLIVLISSAYSGVFQKTGLLNKIKNSVGRLAEKTTSFFAILICSALTGVVACNQTLTIMLTEQLTGDLKTDSEDFANNLEDTAVVIAPLIPWSIACAVPLTSVDAPFISVLFACYLYILPLCGLIRSFIRKHQNNKNL